MIKMKFKKIIYNWTISINLMDRKKNEEKCFLVSEEKILYIDIKKNNIDIICSAIEKTTVGLY